MKRIDGIYLARRYCVIYMDGRMEHVWVPAATPRHAWATYYTPPAEAMVTLV